MSEFFLGVMDEEEQLFDGFYDGQQKIIPEGTELEIVVIDGFNGLEEGKAQLACFIQVAVTTPGEFLGQKYKWNAKIYEMDAGKRDKALKNLTLLDTQAGSPLGKFKRPLTTENIQEHWVGASFARAKFGFMPASEEDAAKGFKDRNYIQGFGFLREKLPQAASAVQQTTEQSAGEVKQTATTADNSDIDF